MKCLCQAQRRIGAVKIISGDFKMGYSSYFFLLLTYSPDSLLLLPSCWESVSQSLCLSTPCLTHPVILQSFHTLSHPSGPQSVCVCLTPVITRLSACVSPLGSDVCLRVSHPSDPQSVYVCLTPWIPRLSACVSPLWSPVCLRVSHPSDPPSVCECLCLVFLCCSPPGAGVSSASLLLAGLDPKNFHCLL